MEKKTLKQICEGMEALNLLMGREFNQKEMPIVRQVVRGIQDNQIINIGGKLRTTTDYVKAVWKPKKLEGLFSNNILGNFLDANPEFDLVIRI